MNACLVLHHVKKGGEKRHELCAKYAHGDVTLNSNAVVTCLCKSSYFKDELMSLSFCFQVF